MAKINALDDGDGVQGFFFSFKARCSVVTREQIRSRHVAFFTIDVSFLQKSHWLHTEIWVLFYYETGYF